MDCIQVNNLLIDYVDGNLNLSLKRELENHLQSCNKCKEDLKEMKIILRDMKAIDEQYPSRDLKEKFMEMLDKEKQGLNTMEMRTHEQEKGIIRLLSSSWGKAGLGAAVLLVGFLIGFVFQPGNKNVAMLENEINIMKKIFMLSNFDESSASERLQVVNYISEQKSPDKELIQSLINTLNDDENINVRIAAASALAKFYNYPEVKDALLNALLKQKNPMLQISLIELFVSMQEKDAVDEFQMILKDNQSPDIVKSQATKGIRALI